MTVILVFLTHIARGPGWITRISFYKRVASPCWQRRYASIKQTKWAFPLIWRVLDCGSDSERDFKRQDILGQHLQMSKYGSRVLGVSCSLLTCAAFRLICCSRILNRGSLTYSLAVCRSIKLQIRSTGGGGAGRAQFGSLDSDSDSDGPVTVTIGLSLLLVTASANCQCLNLQGPGE